MLNSMEITKVNSDKRGDVFTYQVGERTHVIVTINKGFARGGHYHKTGQWHICLAGQMVVRLRHMITGAENATRLTEGQSLYIDPNVAHLFEAEEFSVLAESRIGGPEATDYEPWRKIAIQ